MSARDTERVLDDVERAMVLGAMTGHPRVRRVVVESTREIACPHLRAGTAILTVRIEGLALLSEGASTPRGADGNSTCVETLGSDRNGAASSVVDREHPTGDRGPRRT